MNGLLGPLFPPVCSVCGENACPQGISVCAGCISKLQALLGRKCGVCGKTSDLCDCKRPVNLKFLFFYGDPLSRRLVYGIKYDGDVNAFAFFADLAVGHCRLDTAKYDAVTYVPRLPKTVRRYGFDQAKLIAEALADRLGLPFVTALSRRGGGEQKLMSASDRRRNIAGLYGIVPELGEEHRNKRYLLVDDVVTTGSTITACAKVLRDSGVASAVTAVAIAKTELKNNGRTL